MLKVFATCLLITISSVHCFAQKSYFYQDAVQLAARLVENDNTHEIPQDLIKKIEEALESISNSPSPAANAVMHQYNIRTLNTTNTANAMIIVDKSAEWIKDLSTTPIHDFLPQNANVALKQKEATDDYIMLEMTSELPINMKFIANEISVVNDIWMVEVPITREIGSDIDIRPAADGYLLTFSYRFTRCETGCEDAHYWEFGVDANGEVEFLNEYGSDLSALFPEDDIFTIINEIKM